MKILIQSASLDFTHPVEVPDDGQVSPVINFRAILRQPGPGDILGAVHAYLVRHHKRFFNVEAPDFINQMARATIHADSLKIAKRYIQIKQDCYCLTEEHITNTYFSRVLEGNYREVEVSIASPHLSGAPLLCRVNTEKGIANMIYTFPGASEPPAGNAIPASRYVDFGGDCLVDLYIEGTVLLPEIESSLVQLDETTA